MSGRRVRARAKWIAVLCALAAIAVGVAGARHVIQFVRESRAIEALGSQDEGERRAAIRELAKLGSSRAVLALLASLKLPEGDPPSVVETEASFGSSSDVEVFDLCHEVCAPGIGAIGGRAVAPLRSRLGSADPGERYWSLHFLWRLPELSGMGPGPALQGLLDDPDPRVRSEAVTAMGFSAATSPHAFEDLLADAKRTGSSARRREAVADAVALAALLALRNEPSGASSDHVPSPGGSDSMDRHAVARAAAVALIDAAEDPSPAVRRECIRGLGAIESRWSAYLPEVRRLDGLDLRKAVQDILRRCLGSEDPAIRLVGIQWLFVLHGDEDTESEELPVDVLDLLARCAFDVDPEISAGAIEKLARAEALPVLMRVLEEGDAEIRSRVAAKLAEMNLGLVWSALFDLLDRPDESLRHLAGDLLSSLGVEDCTGIDRVVLALSSEKPEVRRTSARVLLSYRSGECFDDDGLLSLHETGDDEVASQCAMALAWSRNLTVPTCDEVVKLLTSARAGALRRAACRAARSLGPRVESAVPGLVALLEGEPWDGRACSADALGAIGPAAVAAVPALLAAAEGKDLELAGAALKALAAIAPEEHVSAAIRALGHDSDKVRDTAITELWSLGAGAAPALLALRRLADEEQDPMISMRAATLVRLLEARSRRRFPEAR